MPASARKRKTRSVDSVSETDVTPRSTKRARREAARARAKAFNEGEKLAKQGQSPNGGGRTFVPYVAPSSSTKKTRGSPPKTTQTTAARPPTELQLAASTAGSNSPRRSPKKTRGSPNKTTQTTAARPSTGTALRRAPYKESSNGTGPSANRRSVGSTTTRLSGSGASASTVRRTSLDRSAHQTSTRSPRPLLRSARSSPPSPRRQDEDEVSYQTIDDEEYEEEEVVTSETALAVSMTPGPVRRASEKVLNLALLCCLAWSVLSACAWFLDENVIDHHVALGRFRKIDFSFGPKTPPSCFESTTEDLSVAWVEECGDSLVPCPQHGVCADGKLVGCENANLQVDGNQCVLTEAASEATEAIHDLLTSWTIDHVCSPLGNPYVADNVKLGDDDALAVPLFHYTQVVGELDIPYDLSLVDISNRVQSIVKNGDALVGLMSAKVPTPLTCRVQRAFLAGAGGIGAFLLNRVKDLRWLAVDWATLGLRIFLAASLPVQGLGVLFLGYLWAFLRAKKQKTANQKRYDEVMDVKEVAIRILQESAGPQRVDAVRDTVKDDLRVNERLHGKYTPRRFNELWPSVKSKVDGDGRVSDFEKLDGSYWEWAGPRSRRKSG